MEKLNSLVGLVALLAMLVIPMVFASTSGNLGAVLTIGNTAPTVPFVFCEDVTPIAGSVKTITCIMNVTDNNGINDIVFDAQLINITNSSAVVVSTQCKNTKNYTAERTAQFNCSLNFIYYLEPGSNWDVYARAYDGEDYGTNYSNISITVNSLTSLEIVAPANNISFGTLAAGTQDNPAENNPVILNNTGNMRISQVNISANNLTGHTVTTDRIWAANFTANTADAPGGDALDEESEDAVTVSGSSIPYGLPADSKESIYLYVDISVGLTAQEYSATKSGRAWVWGIVS